MSGFGDIFYAGPVLLASIDDLWRVLLSGLVDMSSSSRLPGKSTLLPHLGGTTAFGNESRSSDPLGGFTNVSACVNSAVGWHVTAGDCLAAADGAVISGVCPAI